MTNPIGNNPTVPMDTAPIDGAAETGGTVVSGNELKTTIHSTFQEKLREAARELLDHLGDENYWDAKSDSLVNRDELIEQQKLFEHLEELGLIATKSSVLETLSTRM